MSTVVMVRNQEKREESVHLAEELGWTWRYASPSEIRPVASERFDDFLDDLLQGRARMVVLTNVHSLRYLLLLLQQKGKAEEAVRALNRKGVIAIGEETAQAARKEWIKVAGVWETPLQSQSGPGQPGTLGPGEVIWVVRSEKENRTLSRLLQGSEARVEELAVYGRVKREPDRELLDAWYWTMEGGIDAFAFSSAANAEAFVQGGERRYNMRDFGVALNSRAIGALDEATRRTLERLGIGVDVVPNQATFAALLRDLKTYLEKEF